jgi:hypothetical protein
MKKYWWLPIGIVGMALAVLLCVFAVRHYRAQELARAEQADWQAARIALSRTSKLKTGMSEEEVAGIIGSQNWEHHREYSDFGAPKSVFILGGRDSESRQLQFLVLEWQFQDAPADTVNRSMYMDENRHQKMVRIYEKFHIGDYPQ